MMVACLSLGQFRRIEYSPHKRNAEVLAAMDAAQNAAGLAIPARWFVMTKRDSLRDDL